MLGPEAVPGNTPWKLPIPFVHADPSHSCAHFWASTQGPASCPQPPHSMFAPQAASLAAGKTARVGTAYVICLQEHTASKTPLGEESEKGVRESSLLAQCRLLCSVKFYILILLNRHFSRGFALERFAELPLTLSSGEPSHWAPASAAQLASPRASCFPSSALPYSQHFHKHSALSFCCFPTAVLSLGQEK